MKSLLNKNRVLLPSVSSYCDEDFVTCLSIEEDGSVAPAPIPQYQSGDRLSFAYLDPQTDQLSEAVMEQALENVLYTAQAVSEPQSLAVQGSNKLYQSAMDQDESGTSTRLAFPQALCPGIT